MFQPAAAQRPTAAEIVAFCEARLAAEAAAVASEAAGDASMASNAVGGCTVASPAPPSSSSSSVSLHGVFSPAAHVSAPVAATASVAKGGSGNAQFGAQTLRFGESPAVATTPAVLRHGHDANVDMHGPIQFLSPGAHHQSHPFQSQHRPPFQRPTQRFHATPAPGAAFLSVGLTPSPGPSSILATPVTHSGDYSPTSCSSVDRLSHPTSAAELAMAQEIAALRYSNIVVGIAIHSVNIVIIHIAPENKTKWM